MTATAPRSLNALRYFSPTGGAQEARRPASFGPALAIYAAFLLATALFYAFKPFDFPEKTAFPQDTRGLWFWLKVMAWQPPLEAMWIVFLTAQLEWMRAGKLPLKVLGAVLGTAMPFVLMIVYKQGGIGWTGYALAAVAWLAALAPLLRRASREQWRVLTAFMLGINVIGLAALLPMQLSLWLDSETLYKTGQILGGLWILGAGTLGLRALTGMRLPSCFMSLLFSMFMQIAFAFTLHLLGIVPKSILMALLYA